MGVQEVRRLEVKIYYHYYFIYVLESLYLSFRFHEEFTTFKQNSLEKEVCAYYTNSLADEPMVKNVLKQKNSKDNMDFDSFLNFDRNNRIQKSEFWTKKMVKKNLISKNLIRFLQDVEK